MKKSRLITVALAGSAMLLAACNGQCIHTDYSPKDHKCDKCGEEISEHTFNEWTVRTKPTFETAGEEFRTCSYCGEEETREIPHLEHTYELAYSFDSENHWNNCLDVGYSDLKGNVEEHNCNEQVVVKEATCEEDGLMRNICVCGYETTSVISAKGHNPTLVKGVEPTCARSGVKDCYVCMDCGAYFEDVQCTKKIFNIDYWKAITGRIGQNEHTFGATTYTWNHDVCIATRTCESCGLIIDEVAQATYVADSEATCEEPGLGHYEVTFENSLFAPTATDSASVVGVKPTGHNLSTFRSFDDTYHWFTCANNANEKIEKAAHDFDDVVITKAPTCTSAGKGLRKCHYCDYVVEVTFPQLSHVASEEMFVDADYHWNVCQNNCGEELNLEEHVDLNDDGYCDVCEYEIPEIYGITLEVPFTYMGRGSSMIGKVKVDGNYTADKGYTISFSKNSNIYSAYDNGSDQIYIGCSYSTSTNTYSTVLTVTSVQDPSVSASVSLSCSTYGSAKFNAIESFFGSDTFVPYMYSTTFSAPVENTMRATVTSTTFEKVLGTLENAGFLRIPGRDGYVYRKSMGGSYSYDNNQIVELVVTKGTSSTILDFEILDYDTSAFPKTELAEYLNVDSSEIVLPEDSDFFNIKYDGKVTVYTNSDVEDYMNRLDQAGLCVNGLNAATSDRKYAVSAQVGYYDPNKLDFHRIEVPGKTDWSENAKKEILAAYGTCDVPFVDGGFDFIRFDEFGGTIYSGGSTYDAAFEAMRVYAGNPDFTLASLESEYVTYKKQLNDLQDLSVSFRFGMPSITISTSAKKVNEWKADEVAKALGKGSATLPAVEGATEYSFNLSNKKAVIDATGANINEYMTVLEAASFNFIKYEWYAYYYESTDGTLSVVLRDSFGSLNITVTAQQAAPVVPPAFPLAEVKAVIGAASANDVYGISGNNFVVTQNAKYDVTVEVEKGSSYELECVLLFNGFVREAVTSFTKGNLRVSYTKGEQLSVRYALIEEPAGGFPVAEVASWLSSYDAEDIPTFEGVPGVFTIDTEYTEANDVYVNVTDGDYNAMVAYLSSYPGMTKYSNTYFGLYDGYLCFYLMKTNNTTYTINIYEF